MMWILGPIWTLILRLFAWVRGASLWGWLVYLFASFAGDFAVRALYTLGVSFVAYTYALPQILPYITGPLLQIPEPYISYLAMSRIDQGITIILSAFAVRFATRGRTTRVGAAPWGVPGNANLPGVGTRGF